jgi:hypothetical protein
MRKLSVFRLIVLLVALAPGLPLSAQDEATGPVATLRLADGTSVVLIDWKLTYEFLSWKSKEPMSTAKPRVVTNSGLILGKKTHTLRGDALSFTHDETGDPIRVSTMSLGKVGSLKVESPARDILAPDLDKNMIYQPRSVDIAGKMLSGIERSYCLASFSALVECGGTKTTRVVRIEFN